MSYSLVIDGVIVVLLAVSIYYSVVLNRRLAALRRGEDEMRTKLEEFSTAAARAEEALAGIKAGAAGALEGTAIGGGILERAEILRDDLKFLVDRGDSLIGKTVMTVRSGGAAVPEQEMDDAPGGTLRMAAGAPATDAVSAADAPSQTKGLGRIANTGSAR